MATSDDDPGAPIGFVLAEATVRNATSGRVAQLEQHLSRIAAETRSAGLSARSLDPADVRSPIDRASLTSRQRDIVNRLLDGARVTGIAASLFISRSTVRNHLSGVYRAFDVHSQSELIDLLRPSA